MHSTYSRLIRPFSLSIAAALALSACGGGGSDTPTAVVGAQTGVFVDSAVEGLSYETSSGVKGTTDAQGHFKYNEGDTVTFKLGGVTLGSGKATGTVTPAHIAGGEDNNKFTNLLVLLQSLDTDGDPSNGITLPASLDGTKIAAVAARLNDDPADFTDEGKNAELKDASPQKAIRSRDEARKHYEETQVKTSDFLDTAAGVWVGPGYLLRLTPSGRYMLTIAGLESGNGTEVGTLTRDATTGLITTSNITTDTNGTEGWSHLSADRKVALSIDARPEEHNYTSTLRVTVTLAGQGEPFEFTLRRQGQTKGNLTGAWSTSPDLRLNAPLVLLNGSGRSNYFYVAPEATGGECPAGAVEAGSYYYGLPLSISSVNIAAPQAPQGPVLAPAPTLTFNNAPLTTEGCNFFLSYQGLPLNPRLSEDGLTLTVYGTDGDTVLFKLYRIKRDKDWFQEEWDAWD